MPFATDAEDEIVECAWLDCERRDSTDARESSSVLDGFSVTRISIWNTVLNNHRRRGVQHRNIDDGRKG